MEPYAKARTNGAMLRKRRPMYAQRGQVVADCSCSVPIDLPFIAKTSLFAEIRSCEDVFFPWLHFPFNQSCLVDQRRLPKNIAILPQSRLVWDTSSVAKRKRVSY
jgi:hypothetical protein